MRFRRLFLLHWKTLSLVGLALVGCTNPKDDRNEAAPDSTEDGRYPYRIDIAAYWVGTTGRRGIFPVDVLADTSRTYRRTLMNIDSIKALAAALDTMQLKEIVPDYGSGTWMTVAILLRYRNGRNDTLGIGSTCEGVFRGRAVKFDSASVELINSWLVHPYRFDYWNDPDFPDTP